MLEAILGDEKADFPRDESGDLCPYGGCIDDFGDTGKLSLCWLSLYVPKLRPVAFLGPKSSNRFCNMCALTAS